MTSEATVIPSPDEFRVIFDNTHHFCSLLDLEGTVLVVSPSVLQLGGLRRGEVVGRPLWTLDVWSSQACLQLQDAVAQAALGEPEQLELVVQRAGSVPSTFAFSLERVGTGEKEPAYLLFEGHEVTPWKKTEAALEQQRVFLQAVLDSMSDGVVACDAEGTLTLFNPAARELHNLLEFPLPARAWAERYNLFNADSETRLSAEEVPLYRALHGEVVRNAEMVIAPERAEPRRVLANGRSLIGGDGNHLGAVVAMRDVTATRTAEAALRKSEAQHRAVIDSLSEGVLQHAKDGSVVACNAAAERILGLTRAQLLAQRPLNARWHVIHEDGSDFPSHTQLALVTLRTGEPQEKIVMGVAKPGGVLTWILLDCQPLRLTEGAEPYGAVCSFVDITQLKQTEAQLRHASLHDALTGLPVRPFFRGRLEEAHRHAERNPDYRFAVLYIDLDNFKTVNDTLGHGVGDNLLVTVAQQLEGCVREHDTVARLGGDEFAVLLPHLADLNDATLLAERLLHDLAITLEVGGRTVSISASIGVVFSDQQLGEGDLLDAADTAMYLAKDAGRAQYRVYGETPEVFSPPKPL